MSIIRLSLFIGTPPFFTSSTTPELAEVSGYSTDAKSQRITTIIFSKELETCIILIDSNKI